MCSLLWFPDIVVHCQKSEYRGALCSLDSREPKRFKVLVCNQRVLIIISSEGLCIFQVWMSELVNLCSINHSFHLNNIKLATRKYLNYNLEHKIS